MERKGLTSRIVGTGRAVPDQRVTNDDLSKLVDTSDEWISTRTGIRQRYFLKEGQVTSDLAAESARAALEAARLRPDELDCIVCATVTPDMPLPATGVAVQQKIGAHCPAFDVAAACAGFIYGLSVGDAFIRAGTFRRVLVVGVEALSRFMDMKDRNTCVLFGDGAGAVVLQASEDPARGLLSTHLFADGEQAGLLNIPGGGTAHPTTHATVDARLHYIRMTGKAVFTHAVKNIARASQVALEANGLTPEQIDCVVAHQANLRILEAVAERTRIPLEKFFLNIHRYGNTSSASIPIALDEAVREGRFQPNDLILMSALGGGFAWGSALMRW
jgi:3-oxoacyl-[acyl-carrier-protein] synthase-3